MLRRNQDGFAHHFILPLIVIVLIGLVGFHVYENSPNVRNKKAQTSATNSSSNGQGSNDGYIYYNPAVFAKLPACQDDAYFTSSVIPEENAERIGPLGAINPGSGHNIPNDHMQFLIKVRMVANQPGVTIVTPVLSPGDVHYFGATETQYFQNGKYQRSDWQIAYAPCKEFVAYNAHVDELAGGLKTAVATGKKWCDPASQTVGAQGFKRCTYHFDYVAKAGEQVGSTGGEANGPAGVDWGASDTRTARLQLLDQKLTKYIGNAADLYHTVCPTDYYAPGAAHDFIQSLLPDRPAPRCGAFNQDKAGTVQGAWHLSSVKEDYQQWTEQMSIVHDNVDPSIGTLAIGGGAVKVDSGFTFHPTHSGVINREPSEVRADGKIYCYSGDVTPPAYQDAYLAGKVLVELTGPTTMKVESQTGSCTGSGSFSKPTTYVR